MYYIYILNNPIINLPFYIGVGKENRKSNTRREHQHKKDAIRLREGKKLKKPNKHKLNTILQILDSGLDVQITIHKYFNNEADAFNEEVRLIAQYGRKDLGTGILTNMTDGGEGCVNQSLETRLKRSNTMKGRPSNTKGYTYSQPYSEERCRKISLANKGKPGPNKGKKLGPAWNKGISLTAEQKKNMGAPKGRIPWNKGLTKETDPRVAKNSESTSKGCKGRIPWNKGTVNSSLKGKSWKLVNGKRVWSDKYTTIGEA